MYERGYIPTPGFMDSFTTFATHPDGIKPQGQIRFEYCCGEGLYLNNNKPDRNVRNKQLALVLTSSQEIVLEEHMFEDDAKVAMTRKSQKTFSTKHSYLDHFHVLEAQIAREVPTFAAVNDLLKSSDNTERQSIEWEYNNSKK
jgi:succinate dehydrogenase/fumarate reductase flavoprotein subunit